MGGFLEPQLCRGQRSPQGARDALWEARREACLANMHSPGEQDDHLAVPSGPTPSTELASAPLFPAHGAFPLFYQVQGPQERGGPGALGGWTSEGLVGTGAESRHAN